MSYLEQHSLPCWRHHGPLTVSLGVFLGVPVPAAVAVEDTWPGEDITPGAACAAGVGACRVEAEAGGGGGSGAGVGALRVAAHTTLVDVATASMGVPGGVAWGQRVRPVRAGQPTLHTGATEGAHCVCADGVWSTMMGEVSISALINLLTANIGLMVAIS